MSHNTLTLLVSRENSTVDGRPASPAMWLALDFDAAWVDDGFSTPALPYEYLHVPHVNGETTHRVRCRFERQQVRVGGTVVGRCAGVTLDRSLPPRKRTPQGSWAVGAWKWQVRLAVNGSTV